MRYGSLIIKFFLLTIVMVGSVNASSLVDVKVLKDNKEVAKGIGIIVEKTHVLTSFSLLSLGDQYIIKDRKSNAELLSSKAGDSKPDDLALLKANGLNGKPVFISKIMPQVGEPVLLGISEAKKVKGVLTQLIKPNAEIKTAGLIHSAPFNVQQHGSPVLNTCGHLIGVNRAKVVGVFTLELKKPGSTNTASELGTLKKFLKTSKIAFVEAADKCLNADELLAKVKKDKEAADKAAAELKKKNKELADKNKTDTQAAQDNADKLKKEKEAAAKKTKKIQDDKDAADKLSKEELAEKEKQKQMTLYIAGGILFLVLLVSIILVRKRNKKIVEANQAVEQKNSQVNQMEQELKETAVMFNDILLVGTDETGKEHRLKINGNALARAKEGQTVGRHGQHADHVLNIEQVSRLHLRLIVESDKLYVVDLGSFNGTQVNGVSLAKDESALLKNNDELNIGTFTCKVNLL